MTPDGGASEEMLRTALGHALRSVGIRGRIDSINRRENVYESTHRSEVLECCVGGVAQPAILCKYGPVDDRDHLGLRHGLAYEADVYRYALCDLTAPPRFFGSYLDAACDVSWLFLEYLDEGWQLDLGPETAIVDAAAMLGELHRTASNSPPQAARAKLNRYHEAYFHHCLAQANAQVASWGELVPSFDRISHQFQSAIPYLVAAPRTVVHGEFTPHNVVWAHERPRVVDWEQAATGPGEIDLAALTDDWPPELVELAAEAYVASRWTRTPGHDFAATLNASRLYWLFRWLGDPEQAGTEDEIAWLAERVNEASAL